MSRPRRRGRSSSLREPSSLEGDVAPLGSATDGLPVLWIPKERSATDYRNMSERVLHVARDIPVLSSLAWPRRVKEQFLAAQGRELPKVQYPDRREAFARAEARARAAAEPHRSEDAVDRWMRDTLLSYADAARMLAAAGTPDFSRRSVDIYGAPETRFVDGETTNLRLARHLLETVERLSVPPEDPETLDATAAARTIKRRLREEFPGEGIKVVLSANLASKAIAGTSKVRLRRDARYTRGEIEELVVHEGLVHIATTLNGIHQPLLRCLGKGSPRTMRLQEGLAVFAEFMAGVVNLRRLARLADRVVAIDMAARGADFLEVHRYFLARGLDAEEGYEHARRVFRGGVLTGGAPFTKDVVYLHGAARVRNFLEAALAHGNLDDVPRLFVGKIEIDDLEAMRALSRGGWIAPPRHMPAWARDRGRLAASLSFGSFFREIEQGSVREHYASLLTPAPKGDAKAGGAAAANGNGEGAQGARSGEGAGAGRRGGSVRVDATPAASPAR